MLKNKKFEIDVEKLNLCYSQFKTYKRMEKLDAALIDGIASENLQEIITDGAEIALDSFLSDGILKEIPIFGTLYKGSKIVLNIRDAIFAKMIYKFLFELKDIPTEKRKSFIKKLETQSGYEKKVGEKLIVVIERLDDLDKPTILGKLLKYVIEEKINFNEFLRISTIIQKAFLPDLMYLKKHHHVEQYDQGIKEHLIALGLVNMDLKENTRDQLLEKMSRLGLESVATSLKIEYELNLLGRQVRQFLIDCT